MGCTAPGRLDAAHRLAAGLVEEHGQQMAASATSFFPDVSGYQGGLKIQPGTFAVLAKATEGSTFTDGWYSNFKVQAAQHGAVFGAYHFMWGSTTGEAKHVHNVVGSTPLMLDVENPSVPLSVGQVVALVRAYRALGGVCNLAYIPHWYWQGSMGAASLLPLQNIGVRIVSSNYTGYSDSGAGWAGYGGITPVQWQYTDALPYGGMSVDFNAYKGTQAQYRALLAGSTPTPTPTPNTVTPEDDMITFVQEARVAGDVGGRKHGCYAPVWKSEGGFLDWMNASDFANSQWWASHQWKNAFAAGAVQVVDPGTLGAFGALRPGTAVPSAGQWSGKPLRGYTVPAV
jgi:hypothetical protein